MIAAFTSLVTVLSLFAAPYLSFQGWFVMAGIDNCINVICLYLQYSFASPHYDQFCFSLDVCCNKLMTRNMLRSISKMKRENLEKVLFTMHKLGNSSSITASTDSMREESAGDHPVEIEMTVMPRHVASEKKDDASF